MAVTKKIADVASKRAELSNFLKIVDDLKLSDELNAKGPLTVFAPSNEAFDKISAAINKLSPDELIKLIKDHIIPGKYAVKELPIKVKTLAGTTIDTATYKVAKADLKADNGLVHIVSEVVTAH